MSEYRGEDLDPELRAECLELEASIDWDAPDPEHWQEQREILARIRAFDYYRDLELLTIAFFGLFDLAPLTESEIAAALECGLGEVLRSRLYLDRRLSAADLLRLKQIRNRPVLSEPAPQLSSKPLGFKDENEKPSRYASA